MTAGLQASNRHSCMCEHVSDLRANVAFIVVLLLTQQGSWLQHRLTQRHRLQ